MVSSETVTMHEKDLSTSISKYTSTIVDLASSWKGKSYNNLQSKSQEVSQEYLSTIENQMNSYISAIELYKQFKQIKDNLQYLKGCYYQAQSEKNTSAAEKYYNQYHQYYAQANKLIPQIQSALQAASTPKYEVEQLMASGLGEFVNYYQYNYTQPYSQGTIATSGCGPTSLAMVLTYLLGKEITPVETAAKGNGRYTCNKGTYWSYFGDMASQYGVSCEQMGVSSDNIIKNLKAGKTLIVSMGPGHFTNQGHFIVVRGLDENGRAIVADPNSETRSNQTWDISILVNEGSQLWALSNEK